MPGLALAIANCIPLLPIADLCLVPEVAQRLILIAATVAGDIGAPPKMRGGAVTAPLLVGLMVGDEMSNAASLDAAAPSTPIARTGPSAVAIAPATPGGPSGHLSPALLGARMLGSGTATALGLVAVEVMAHVAVLATAIGGRCASLEPLMDRATDAQADAAPAEALMSHPLARTTVAKILAATGTFRFLTTPHTSETAAMATESGAS